MNEPKTELIGGAPVPADRSHTEINPKTGMQKEYVVLSPEERAKGFVRPVRKSYVHVGPTPPKYPLRALTDEEAARYSKFGYVKFEEYPKDSGHGSATGRFWTQADLDKKGCGGTTTMHLALAETYARQPGFYGGTFCASCGEHFPVGADGEFVWEGTEERVGT
jgi:hypothetical protein